MIKLNLGCGSIQPEGWINVDYSLGARLSKIPFYNSINKRIKLLDISPEGLPRIWDDKTFIHNLNNRFPWNDDSVDVIYCSHTLEHFSKLEGQTLLQECRRVLKKGGIIRIVVPDLKSFIEMYYNGKMRADDFVENLGVLYEKKKNPIKNLLITIMQFPHKCMYDSETLLNIMNSLGFDVEHKQPFESNILDINNLELAERTEKAVIIEGIKR